MNVVVIKQTTLNISDVCQKQMKWVDYMNPSAQKIQELSVHYSNSLNILTAAKEKDGGVGQLLACLKWQLLWYHVWSDSYLHVLIVGLLRCTVRT